MPGTRHTVALAAMTISLLMGWEVKTVCGLDRVAVPAPEERASWTRSPVCEVQYYNSCSGWVWVWSNWGRGDRVGVIVDPCDYGYSLDAVMVYVAETAPVGYGYTGLIGAFSLDHAGCPIWDRWWEYHTRPFLPLYRGWHYFDVVTWGAPCALLIQFGSRAGNPIGLASDHPAISLGGMDCGSCYPATRPTHTFYWGSEAAPLCPGSPLFDGTCNAELLVEATLTRNTVAMEPATWGRLKSLYR